MSGWRVAAASVGGSSHAVSGAACQDSHRVQFMAGPMGDPVLVACASDGAGSAPRSKAGADLACQAWIEAAQVAVKTGVELDRTWIQFVKKAIEDQARDDCALSSDYACTFLGACLYETRAMFLQVGDGAMVVSSHSVPGDFELVFWPDQGEYANTTRFVTDATFEESIRLIEYFVPIDEVGLFTDGLQRLVLSYESKTAYKPFFESVFGHLRADNPHDPAESSKALEQFLSSESVSQRTDDDRTLVLVSRAEPNSYAPTEP